MTTEILYDFAALEFRDTFLEMLSSKTRQLVRERVVTDRTFVVTEDDMKMCAVLAMRHVIALLESTP